MPYKTSAARREYARKRYREKRDLVWKNPDGSWKRSNVPPEVKAARSRKKYAEDPEFRERSRARAMARRLAKRVDGDCPICQQHRRLVWDHNHQTGFFRGYICNPCNLVLGHSYENPQTLQRAILYLESSLTKTNLD